MLKFRFVGPHAETLANGRPIGPGEFVELSEEDVREPHNEMLIADGSLIGADDDAEHQESLAERRVRSRLSRAEDEGDENKGGDS